MTTNAAGGSHWWRDQAACADPAHLPLVDAAFTQPGGPAGQAMRATLCRHCPVKEPCLAEALTTREFGIWAGTSGGTRTRLGAPHSHSGYTTAGGPISGRRLTPRTPSLTP